MTPAGIVRRQLDELASLVMSIDAAVYRARPLPNVSGSVGEHVRHCLDHIAALAASDSSHPLSYDRRERGTAVETDRAEALRQIIRLKAALDRWHIRTLDDPISVTSLVTHDGDAVTGWSTIGRELAFVTSHTTHHQALIAALLSLQDVDVPDRLGYAPSTPKQAV